ncbi:MAG: flagellar biosynthesis anti-sigma factor FlgM [Methylobacter sp.]|nr:flagellar biosynthesis anti-sigma factor FlgM [Methylobacter sp.]
MIAKVSSSQIAKVFSSHADKYVQIKVNEDFQMAIESITGRTPNQVTTKTDLKTEIGAAKTAPVKDTEKDDSVAITSIAHEIKKAFESSSSLPAVDIDRVNAVKKALADGNYPINAERIAQKIIQFDNLFAGDNST